MTDLCHECGRKLNRKGLCPRHHTKAQPCPDAESLRAACEAVRATWPQHRLERCELRREVVVERVQRTDDGMVRRKSRRVI